MLGDSYRQTCLSRGTSISLYLTSTKICFLSVITDLGIDYLGHKQ